MAVSCRKRRALSALEADSQSVAVFLLGRDLLLWRLDGLLLRVLRRVGALAGDLMPQRGGQLLAIVGEELRIVRSARDGDIGVTTPNV